VSNQGRVRSFKNGRKERILHQRYNNRGYPIVTLSNNSEKTHPRVHRLVALAFLPNPCNKPEINHIDMNKHNSHLSNLEWCDRLENVRKAHELKTDMGTGENNSMSLLSNEQALEIFELKGKEKAKDVCYKYGVSRTAICDIWSGRRWSSVTGYVKEQSLINHNQMQQEICIDITDLDYWL
jgi:hypothetical protein